MEDYIQIGKSPRVELALCFFLGGFGAHKFYMHKTLQGILYLFTCGFYGICPLIDFIQLLLNYIDISKNNADGANFNCADKANALDCIGEANTIETYDFDKEKSEILNSLAIQHEELLHKSKLVLNRCESMYGYKQYIMDINSVLDTIEQHNCNMVVIGKEIYSWDYKGEHFIGRDEGIFFATIDDLKNTVYSGFVTIIKPLDVPEDSIEDGSIKLVFIEDLHPNRFILGRSQDIWIREERHIEGNIVLMSLGLLELYINDYHKEDVRKMQAECERQKKEEEQHQRERSSNIPM